MFFERICKSCGNKFLAEGKNIWYCGNSCREISFIKQANDKWAKRDIKAKKEKMAKRCRNLHCWAMTGVGYKESIPGLKRFKTCRG